MRPFLRFGLVAVAFAACAAPLGRWNWDNSEMEGDERALCESAFKHLISAPASCAMDALATFPGFSDVPWESLDTKQYVDLIAELEKYEQEQPEAYFSSTSRTSDQHYRVRAEDFIRSGGTLQVWRGHLLSHFDTAQRSPALAEPQTIILKISHLGASDPVRCSGRTRLNGWIRGIYVVKSDLSGPDPRVDGAIASLLSTKWPVFYRGQLRLVGYDDVWIKRAAGLGQSCGFTFDESNPLQTRKTTK